MSEVIRLEMGVNRKDGITYTDRGYATVKYMEPGHVKPGYDPMEVAHVPENQLKRLEDRCRNAEQQNERLNRQIDRMNETQAETLAVQELQFKRFLDDLHTLGRATMNSVAYADREKISEAAELKRSLDRLKRLDISKQPTFHFANIDNQTEGHG